MIIQHEKKENNFNLGCGYVQRCTMRQSAHHDPLQKRFNNLHGIACYRNISDKRPVSSVKMNSINGMIFDNFIAFDHGDTSLFY